MEDEKSDVGQVSSSDVSASSLDDNLRNETLVENMDSENQVVEESYEEEIMVEVVGSDVFVDGVSGDKEIHFESGEVGVLEGEKTEESEIRNLSEAMNVSSEGDRKSDLGLSEPTDEKHFVGTKEVYVGFSKSAEVESDAVKGLPLTGVDVSGDDAWNPGIEAMDLPTGEDTTLSPMVIGQEKETKDETVDKDSCDLAIPEPLNHPSEAQNEKKDVLTSGDNAASQDHVVAESMISDGKTKTADGSLEPGDVSLNLNPNCEGLENVPDHGMGSVVAEGRVDNATAGGETLESALQKDVSFMAEGTDVDSHTEDKSTDEKEASTSENNELVVKPDALISDVQDEKQSCLNEFDEIKYESKDPIDYASHAAPEVLHENSAVSEKEEAIGNDECLETGGDLETYKACENHVSSDDPVQLADGGDTPVVNEDKCHDIEMQDDREENEPSTMSLSFPALNEVVQADSGIDSNEPVIATTVGAEVDDQNVIISLVEVVEGGGSSEKGEELSFEMSNKSVECKGNAEIPALSDSDLPAEGADATLIQDNVVCHNPIVDFEVGFDNFVEEYGSSQSTKKEALVQITETSNHEVDKIENDNLVPKEVASVPSVQDISEAGILPGTNENAELIVSSINISLLDGGDIKENPGCDMADDKPRESNGFYIRECHTSEAKPMDVEEERESYDGGEEVDTELGTEGPSSEIDKLKSSNEETANFLRMNQSGYLSPPKNEGHFAVSDLVWGKVRSHPWWPGQIFDPADASEKAIKYYKKDSYLVAYFGDQTFAWNDPSALKPFRSYFPQIEKQSNSESFQNAVDCALEEVERRVELGLACSCIPKDAYGKIESQVVENTGIREESSRRYGVDQSSQASCFEPNKLLEYVRALAPRTSSLADRLDLVIAQAQLSAICRFKGYRSPAEFPTSGELLEIDADTEQINDEMVASHKSRYTPKDDSQLRKERSLTELMGDREYLPDAEDESVALSSGRKRKALNPLVDGSDKRVSVYAAKVSTSTSQPPKPSFRIGECIRRVASQLTGAKGSNDEMIIDNSPHVYEQSEKQSVVVSAESFSVNEMLSQLQLVALEPKKRHNVQNNIRSFFLGFRSSIALNRRGRKKKSEQTMGGSGEEFEFDDVNDSYWTDRIVQNYSEEQLLHDSENGGGNLQVVTFGTEKSVKPGRRPYARKRYSSGISPTAPSELDESAKRRRQESSPAELILNFAERNCVPSEINLNKIFRRFGPLMESETEVDHESGSAKVIFKRGSDAEVAQNSSEKFNIFGPVLINYQIGYSPLISVKILPVAVPQPQDDATLMLQL